MVLTPYINSAAGGVQQLAVALAAGNAGPLDWACASVSANTAGARGMAAPILGTVLAKYAPAECR
jgi:type IV pilus assembly protein PilA